MAAISLKDMVRARISVTWSDPATDARIDDAIIPAAEAAIRQKVGIPDGAGFEFGAPGSEAETMLLLAHCYYQWNNAEDEFDGNYGHEIAQARIRWEVLQNAQAEEAPAGL
ncbi:hypothetical protein [Adlercreutzia faecimuris]|uniref:Phage gp6-like head-tail connector protein n=1 Tax=Adlercreutzia faecimuris TaxID=2897341 RepID=A0ABS9WF68_9ACTN|nr:hypothetical protein [Adlercreutzia sp. JBNU-10]MCI2241513.1 hypothetical protein [Adlercreutzia sp. JBNU-10]